MRIFLLISLLFSCMFKSTKIDALEEENTINLALEAEAAILIEESSGEILYTKNEHAKLYPASMTKMMGMLLIMEDVYNNKHTMDEIVTTSPIAASMGGSQIFL